MEKSFRLRRIRMFKFSKATLAQTLMAAAITVLPQQGAIAAPGNLPAAPLFLSTIVEPNVFFTLDDSGSMDWGPMQSSTSGLATHAEFYSSLSAEHGHLYPAPGRRHACRMGQGMGSAQSPREPQLLQSQYQIQPVAGNQGGWYADV
jgi:hypothetical protein